MPLSKQCSQIGGSETATTTTRATGSIPREPWYSGKGVGELALITYGWNVTLQGSMRRIDATRWCLKTLAEPDNLVSQTRYIPLRLHDRPPQPNPPFNACPIDLMTPATDMTPRSEPTEQREEDYDNVPNTGSFAESSAADTSGTSESSPGSLSTTETGEAIDMASSKTSGSTSSSEGLTESDSAPSTLLSPRRTSTPYTEEAVTAKVSSRPPSPSLADSSLEVR